MSSDISIAANAFFGNGSSFKTIYFGGNEAQWQEISKDLDNISGVEIIYNYRESEKIRGDVNGDDATDNKDVVSLFRYVSTK